MQGWPRRSIGLAAVIAVVAAGALASCGTSSSTSPTIISLSPAYGPTHGGTAVTIVGRGFSGTTTVDFGTWAAPFKIVNATHLTATAPKGIGSVDVTVKTTSGTLAPSPPVTYSFVPAPTVRAIVPSTAAGRGGSTVVIEGTNFVSGAIVLVGNGLARVTDVKKNSIVAQIPPGYGVEELRVVTHGGTSRTSPSTTFRYRTTVLVIGDSLGIDLGWGFNGQLPDGNLLSVTDDSVGSTGLVRSDYYSWPKHLRTELRTLKPDVVVALFGANDEQAIRTSGAPIPVGTKAWSAAYSARIRTMVKIVAQSGATLLWVGLPRMGPKSDLSEVFASNVDALGQATVPSGPLDAFVSTATLFTTHNGRYTPNVRLGGAIENGRQPDGVHLTPAGATAIDELAIDALLRLIGVAPR